MYQWREQDCTQTHTSKRTVVSTRYMLTPLTSKKFRNPGQGAAGLSSNIGTELLHKICIN